MEKARQEWRTAIIELVRKGWYKSALQMMARNCGDGGDVESRIEAFCENCDPADDWRGA